MKMKANIPIIGIISIGLIALSFPWNDGKALYRDKTRAEIQLRPFPEFNKLPMLYHFMAPLYPANKDIIYHA